MAIKKTKSNKSSARKSSSTRKSSGFQSLGSIIQQLDLTKDKYLSREWQAFGVKLSQELGDPQHKSLYIKMARDEPRQILQQALTFVKDARARSKARLWMWKVQQLKKESRSPTKSQAKK
jgi:hypothetical protein